MILQCDVTMLLSVWRLLITAQPFFLCPASWPYDTMRFFRVLPDGDGFAPEHSDSGVFFSLSFSRHGLMSWRRRKHNIVRSTN